MESITFQYFDREVGMTHEYTVPIINEREDRERRHLEMMAATIAAGCFEVVTNHMGQTQVQPKIAPEGAVDYARAIQAEVAEQGATNAELEAVCPVPPFPGIRGGGAGE